MKVITTSIAMLLLSAHVMCAAGEEDRPSIRGSIRLSSSPDRSLQPFDWTSMIESFRPSVVNVETSSEVVFQTQSRGTSYATGFVVDANRGVIATNQHVTGTSPSQVKISFYDGSFTEARRLYYDPTHDFGFYQIDPDDVLFNLEAVTLGSSASPPGDELLLIGNNEKEEYSIKFGRVVNLNVNKGDRHSSYIHTTFDRTGGSSGSPVWNAAGEVIGIHSRGTATSSFELPVEYFADALAKLQASTQIQRGEIGVDLALITIGEATKHFNLPDAVREEVAQGEFALSGGTPKVIQVESTIPKSPGEMIFRAGDIIHKINGTVIRDDLYQFDATLDQNVGKSITLEVYRNGEQNILDVPIVDLELMKTERFARYAGAIFHDITPELRRMLYVETDGVFMSYSDPGSSFYLLGSKSRDGNSKVVIIEMNGKQISSLNDFIQAVRGIQHGTHTYAVLRDFNRFDSSPMPYILSINLKYEPLKVFKWNASELDWEEEVEEEELSSATPEVAQNNPGT